MPHDLITQELKNKKPNPRTTRETANRQNQRHRHQPDSP